MCELHLKWATVANDSRHNRLYRDLPSTVKQKLQKLPPLAALITVLLSCFTTVVVRTCLCVVAGNQQVL